MSVFDSEEPHRVSRDASTVELVIAAKPRDIGGFQVRRALPSIKRRMIGPFVFWDHMGPASFEPGTGMDVRPHPHINLATVTYLFEGEIVHKDSLGSDQSIRPGAVNWMTAGRGIVHSERTGPELRRHGSHLHGIQSWIALPRDHEEAAPAFHHHAANAIPEAARPGARLRIIAGSAYGETSPVQVFSPMFYVEAVLESGARLDWPEGHEERAAYVVEGTVACDGASFAPGAAIVARRGATGALTSATTSRVMLFGGAPLEGPRHLFWNFVSSSPDRIEKAKHDWKEGLFPKVPGDDVEFIPLPE